MFSQAMTWALSLALIVILPRFLGPTAIGQFHLSGSIWAIMAILVSFGMDILMTKEIARRPDRVSELVGTSLGIRVIFYIISFGLVAAYVAWADYPRQTVLVIYVVGISYLMSQCAAVYRSALAGLERMRYIALADIAAKFFTTACSLVLLFLGQGVLVIAAVLIISATISLVIQAVYVNRFQPVRLQFNRELAAWMLRESVPYLGVSLFRMIYIQLDIVIISLLASETVVGWYGAADSLFGTLLFIPTVFITAVFPALSRFYTEQLDSLKHLMQKSFNMLLLLSVPIGLGIFTIADDLVVLLFGSEFAQSGPVLAVMGIVLIFTYSNMLIGKFLIATNRQRQWTKVMAIATMATIPLDLVLIPWCQQTFGNGAIGGALAFVVTEAGILIAGLQFLPTGSLGRVNLWASVRTLFAGILMALVVWQLRSHFIAIPVIVGILLYCGLILLMGVIPKEDLQTIQSLGKNALLKFRTTQTQPS